MFLTNGLVNWIICFLFYNFYRNNVIDYYIDCKSDWTLEGIFEEISNNLLN